MQKTDTLDQTYMQVLRAMDTYYSIISIITCHAIRAGITIVTEHLKFKFKDCPIYYQYGV